MKKAYLVSFSPVTRIVIDVQDDSLEDPQEFALAVRTARQQMIENGIDNYLDGDNIDEIVLDEECPYNEEENE